MTYRWLTAFVAVTFACSFGLGMLVALNYAVRIAPAGLCR